MQENLDQIMPIDTNVSETGQSEDCAYMQELAATNSRTSLGT